MNIKSSCCRSWVTNCNWRHMASPITIKQALDIAQQQLSHLDDNTHLEAEILLSHVLECSRTRLHTWPEQVLTKPQADNYQALLARRLEGEPIAYITGQRGFWDMELGVTPDTLIPRPETERLVELALERIPADAHWQIADLGTGSGAIALAIARERPRCHVLATDLSPAALAVARDNAKRLGVSNIRFQNSHWFKHLDAGRFEMIVSNPPYIHPQDPHLSQGDLRFEPSSALRSGADGLEDIRHIARAARAYLSPPGWLLLEHGYDQGPTITTLLSDLGYEEISIYQDLSGNDRVSAGKWAGTSK